MLLYYQDHLQLICIFSYFRWKRRGIYLLSKSEIIVSYSGVNGIQELLIINESNHFIFNVINEFIRISSNACSAHFRWNCLPVSWKRLGEFVSRLLRGFAEGECERKIMFDLCHFTLTFFWGECSYRIHLWIQVNGVHISIIQIIIL
jgi:hypothetical protein